MPHVQMLQMQAQSSCDGGHLERGGKGRRNTGEGDETSTIKSRTQSRDLHVATEPSRSAHHPFHGYIPLLLKRRQTLQSQDHGEALTRHRRERERQDGTATCHPDTHPEGDNHRNEPSAR